MDLTENLTQARESGDIDRNIGSVLNVMENVCDPLFVKKINVPTEGSNDLKYINKQNRPLFDEECNTLRDRFYRELNKYREDKNNITETHMINARSNFKTAIRKQQQQKKKKKKKKKTIYI